MSELKLHPKLERIILIIRAILQVADRNHVRELNEAIKDALTGPHWLREIAIVLHVGHTLEKEAKKIFEDDDKDEE